MKRAILSLTLGLAALFSLSAQTTPVRLGVDTAVGGSYEFRTALAQGYFLREGLQAATFNFAFGIDTVNALLVDRVDTALAADFVVVNSLARGDLVVVSTLSHTTERTKGNTALLVRDSIKTPQDLVGKKLGVARATVLEYTWAKYLEKNNIDPKSVTFVPYTSPDEAAVGFQRGDIDALWQLGALVDKFLTFPKIKRFGDLGDAGTSTDGYLLLQRAFVEKNPGAVAGILRAIRDGALYVKAHPAETGALAFKELKLPADIVAKDVERNDYSLGFTEADWNHLSDLKRFVESKGLIKVPYNLADKVVLGPLKQAFPSVTVYEPRR